MRRYRAHGITVLALLLLVSGCNPTSAPPVNSSVAEAPVAQAPVPVTGKPIPITLAHEGYAGHPFQVGDTLTWTTLDESPSKSYKLTFPKNNPACSLPPTASVTVTPTQSFSCQAMAPTSGKAVYYKIQTIPNPTGPVSNPNPGPSPPGGITVYSAIPCKICT
jgi:hypothetical protein